VVGSGFPVTTWRLSSFPHVTLAPFWRLIRVLRLTGGTGMPRIDHEARIHHSNPEVVFLPG
jgi:hypothetical protein